MTTSDPTPRRRPGPKPLGQGSTTVGCRLYDIEIAALDELVARTNQASSERVTRTAMAVQLIAEGLAREGLLPSAG